MGIHDELPDKFVDHLAKGRREIIEKTDVLIVDEISMLHDYRLDMVDEVCRLVRRKDVPFGGIQVIMSGDFFQLPPINRGDSRAGGFVVNSNVWQELDPTICYLEEQHRQLEHVFEVDSAASLLALQVGQEGWLVDLADAGEVACLLLRDRSAGHRRGIGGPADPVPQ